MSRDHAQFEQWDAAFVLGALSPADRRAFEEHLDGCDRCARAIAEIAPTLGLLSRVDPARAASLLDEPADDAPATPGGRLALLDRAARERRARRARWGAGIAAAAAVVAAVAAPVVGLAQREARTTDLVPLVDAPLVASVELDPAAWGTRVGLECRYDGEARGDAAGGVPYVLVVTDTAGVATEVSTWRAAPGDTARLSAGTALDVDEIASLEIRLEGDDVVLMRADIDGG